MDGVCGCMGDGRRVRLHGRWATCVTRLHIGVLPLLSCLLMSRTKATCLYLSECLSECQSLISLRIIVVIVRNTCDVYARRGG